MTITLGFFFPGFFSISFLREFISFSSFSNFEESFLSNFLQVKKETPTIQHEKVRGRKTLLIKIVGIRHCPETNTQTQDTGICLETEQMRTQQESWSTQSFYDHDTPGFAGLNLTEKHESICRSAGGEPRGHAEGIEGWVGRIVSK